MLRRIGDLGEDLGDGAGWQRLEDRGDRGEPVSSATSRCQSVPSGGWYAVRGPHNASGCPGSARSTQAEAGPLSPWRTINIVNSRVAGSHWRTV